MVMAEYATRSRTPIRVGFYDIVRTIGRGNFAVVKLARHRITKTEVAIKIIDKMRLDQLNLKNIYREIQVLKLLTHQNIIKLYQVMETSSKIYLVCEYARNGELFDYITEQGRLPEDKAKRMFWQVLTAVEYCHKNNVVHRDLKAENLLLDTNNNVKLADFGFSNFYQSGSLLSTWCGSPPYAAPEVFEGKLYDGPHLDIWSLGVVLYVLVCGTFPFDGSNLATLKERVLGGRFRIPYWMSQDCENLVRHMLVINPKKRLTIAQIKKHKWMQECVTTPSPNQATNSPKISRRGKLSEYNEHVLKIMQGLGINRQKIIESLSLSAYDHLYAIYHLLVDRLKLHRTSFPLEGSISYDGGRRRPSNVAEQALSSTNENSSAFLQQRKLDTKSGIPSNIPWSNSSADICFDEMTTGLPTVHHALTTPVRYASPPLPQIRTSMYDGTGERNVMLPHTPTYTPQPNEEIAALRQKPQLLSLDYKQQSVDSEKPVLENYNLYKRRHTLMVPNPSQMQMLRAGMSSADQTSSQASLERAKTKMPSSGQTSQNFSTIQNATFETSSCGVPTCRDQSCHCQQTSNLLLPCKNLPNSAGLMNFNQANVGIKSQIRRNSGIPTPLMTEQLAVGDNTNVGNDSREGKVAFIIKQRQQLDSSPIGFRQGRRASDGLLLLGDNMLKERLQKLAQGSAVPEITCEDTETSMIADENSRDNNYLQLPSQTPVNRTKSAERNLILTPTSPSLSPVGSGNNISYQPYDNNQSLARRRSLHAQQMQIRNVGSSSSPSQYDTSESNHLRVASQSHNPTVPNQVIPTPSGWQSNISTGSNCHWSSWKHVQGNNPNDDNDAPSQSMWQQLTLMRSNIRNDGDMSTLAVASDEAVAMKAMTAQEQRDQKPIRQQSLPITSNNTSHPFGSNQNPSMAQMLQQRRLQRRLKVAATNMNQVPPYQLPEIEHLRIDNNAALQQNQAGQEYFNIHAQQHNGQEWVEQQWSMHNPAITANPLAIQQPTMDQNIIFDCDNSQEAPFMNQVPVTTQVSDQHYPWTLDFPAYYKKSLEFNAKSILVSDSLSKSSERLDHSGTESMEFAMY